MSNNIYDILKKMAGLEAPKQTLTEGKKAKPDFADLDRDGNKKEPMKKAAKEKDKGAIAEAVAQVERQLNEKYMGFKKKMSEERKEIPISVIDGPGGYKEEQGRINKHEASKVKRQEMPGRELPPIEDRYTKPDGNKDQKVQRQEIPGPELPPVDNRSKPADKPKTKAVDESGLQAYLGKKKYGEQGMRALQKAGREGASKEKMALLRAKHNKMDEGNYNEDMLSPKQQKIARMAGNPDKIDANDLKALRAGKKKKDEGNAYGLAVQNTPPGEEIKINGKGTGDIKKESKTNMREGWEEMQKYLDKKRGPESKGGAGKKAGTRYGGSAQKDDDEETDDEGKPVEKKKGRPKGTGGGAKHSFKKPKD